MPDGEPAARAERQILVHPVVLHEVPRDVVELDGRLHRDVADRQPADPARRRQVALEQPGRHRQHVGVVVEPERRVVCRQEGGDIGIERQQIADGVGVFGAVQTMNAGASRVGPERGGLIEGRLEAGRETVLERPFGPGQPGRGHGAASQLANDLFPHRGSGPDRLGADALEGEICRLQPVVMTAETVAFDERLVVGGQGEARRSGRVATLCACATPSDTVAASATTRMSLPKAQYDTFRRRRFDCEYIPPSTQKTQNQQVSAGSQAPRLS